MALPCRNIASQLALIPSSITPSPSLHTSISRREALPPKLELSLLSQLSPISPPLRSAQHASLRQIRASRTSTCPRSQPRPQSRREALLSLLSTSAIGTLWHPPPPCRADESTPATVTPQPEASSSVASESPPQSGSPPSRKPASAVVDFSDWTNIYGEGFALRVPPGFVNVLPPPEEDTAPQSTLTMQKKTSKGPFAAQFATPDGTETIQVLLQPATKVKLTFFEVDNISSFGSIDEAARLFVSPGAKILARRQFEAAWLGKRPRTYYLYEFVSGGVRTAMSVVASAGYVFVMGASAPEDKWRPAAARLRAAAGAFQLTV